MAAHTFQQSDTCKINVKFVPYREKSVHEVHFHTNSSPEINQDAAGLALTEGEGGNCDQTQNVLLSNNVATVCLYARQVCAPLSVKVFLGS